MLLVTLKGFFTEMVLRYAFYYPQILAVLRSAKVSAKFITGMKAELVNREADEDLAVLQNSYQLDFDPKSRVVSDDEEFY